MATGNPRRKLRQDGTVAWQARYRDPDGRQRAKEFTKKVDAERFLATSRADMARGDWINPADAKRLFADVAEHWRSAQVHADTTAAAVAGDLRNHILPAFGDREIGRIRHSDVQAWVRRLSPRSPARQVPGARRRRCRGRPPTGGGVRPDGPEHRLPAGPGDPGPAAVEAPRAGTSLPWPDEDALERAGRSRWRRGPPRP